MASSPELVKHNAPPSIFSNDIWLGDNSGASGLFAREVEIRGWTSVGDKLGGAYVGEWNVSHSVFGYPVCSLLVISCVTLSGLTVDILVYECVVRTKEVNDHSCSVPVHRTLVFVQACDAGRREV